MSDDSHRVRRAADALRWIRRPTPGDPDGAGGVINLCYNAVDRHVVAGRADETAVTGERTWSYAALLEDVAALAGALRMLGAAERSPVPLLLPAGADLTVATLACLRLGAVPHVLPVGLDAGGLAAVLDGSRPGVMLVAGGTPWREALERSEHEVGSVVVRQPSPGPAAELTEPRDLEWDFVARAGRNDPAPCARVASEEPAYAVLDGRSGEFAVEKTGRAGLLAAAGGAADGTLPALLASLVSGSVLDLAPLAR
ncbi:AMP-binding protein [Nocardioidaceae bacterium]|nr:AMP-binding protein [Nocardioidaceae bacterium]